MVSTGMGDLDTCYWAQNHRPNSRNLSIKMLAPKFIEERWKMADKTKTPKEFKTMQDFRVSMTTLEGRNHKVILWNMTFKTLYFFMVSDNFRESELSGKPNKLTFLPNFMV